MSISSVGGQQPPSIQNRLLSDLEKNGLSDATASTVSSQIESVVQSAKSSGSGKPDPTSVREAINQKLSEDVQNGTITQDEADKVTSTLDQFEAQMKQGGGAGGPPPGGGAPPAGGGGDASSSSSSSSSSSTTVVSTTSTTSAAGVTTTTTTYADGSKNTSTSYNASDATTSSSSSSSSNKSVADILKEMLSNSTQDSNTTNYLAKMLGSGLIDTSA